MIAKLIAFVVFSFSAPVFVSTQSLLADTLNQKVSPPLSKSYPTVPYRLFELIRPSVRSIQIGNGQIMLQSSAQDGAIYILGDELVRVSSTWPSKVLEKPIPIPEKRFWDEQFQMKFRNGSWYCRSHTEIWCLKSNFKKWEMILDADRNFSQFEIAPDGRILLIASGIPQVADKKHVYYRNPNSHNKLDSMSFISVYSEGSNKPEKELDFPSEFKLIEKQVGHVIGPNHSFWNDGKLVIHSAETGRIWCLIWEEWAVREIDTPWGALNNAYLESIRDKVKIVKIGQTSVAIPTIIFPEEFAFFATNSDLVQLVVRWPGITQPMKDEIHKNIKEISSLYSGVVDFELRGPKAELFELDLREYKIRSRSGMGRETQLLGKHRNGYLIEFDGTPVPFPVYVAPEEQPKQNPAK